MKLKITKQIAEFEKDNPKIAEALKVFDISFKEYQKAIEGKSTQKTFVSGNTIFRRP